MKQLRKHLSVANVLSCIALFVALSGAAYAATTATRNSVKAKSIAKGAVTTPKLKNGAVTNAKLRNGAVTGAKIAPATIGSSQLATGAVRSGQLGGGVVTSAKLKNGAVTGEKLGSGAVTNSKLGADAVATGKIQDGAVTAAKLSTSTYAQLLKNASYVAVTSKSDTEPTKTATAECPAGKQVVGGGAKVVGGDVVIAITDSSPVAPNSSGKRTAWTASASEVALSGVAWAVEAHAICAEF